MSMKDKMHSGELYLPGDEEILKEQFACLEKLYDFNATRPRELEKRAKLLQEMFAEIGEGCYIEPPLHANWGGTPSFQNYEPKAINTTPLFELARTAGLALALSLSQVSQLVIM